MKAFISWSGDLSKAIAEILRQWLRRIIPTLRPFVSTEDIGKGSVWLVSLLDELGKSSAGIICVTRESLHSRWLLFEAGALAKQLDRTQVCTLLVDVSQIEMQPPLSIFQSTTITKGDMLRLVRNIHSSLADSLYSDRELEDQFEKWWPNFEHEVRKALSAPISHRSEIQEIAEELLLPVIYREARSGDLDTVFHWLQIAKQRQIADLEGRLAFVEASLARLTGKRGAQKNLSQMGAKTGEFAGDAYVEWLFLQFAGHRRVAELNLDDKSLDKCNEDARRTASALIGLWHFSEGSSEDAARFLKEACPDKNAIAGPHDCYRALVLGVLCCALGNTSLGEKHLDLAKLQHSIPNEGYPFVSLTRDFDRWFVTAMIGHGERALPEKQIRDFRGHAWVLARYAEILLQCPPALEALVAHSQSWKRPLNYKSASDRLSSFQRRLVSNSGAPQMS